MGLRIRLRRVGKRKQPQYRLVVAEAASPRDGRFVEAIGHCNPRLDPRAISVNEERALYWLRQGAQPSETALSILKAAGVWAKFGGATEETAASIVAEPTPAAEVAAAEVPEAEAPEAEAPEAEAPEAEAAPRSEEE